MSSTEIQLPNGPAWAAILAAGIGCACFGLLVDLSEAFHAISNALNFYSPSGDLSGKSTLAILAWVVVWIVLHARWKARTIMCPGRITAIAVGLVLYAMIATFPPFIDLFAAK